MSCIVNENLTIHLFVIVIALYECNNNDIIQVYVPVHRTALPVIIICSLLKIFSKMCGDVVTRDPI